MPATNKQHPPMISAYIGWLPMKFLRRKPRIDAATSCGITIKKLKMPMYVPIFDAGTLSDSNVYGSDKIDAHAIPTPTIEMSSMFGSLMKGIDKSPSPPNTQLIKCALRTPMPSTNFGMTIAHNAANKLYAANSTPTQFAPSLYAALVVSELPN